MDVFSGDISALVFKQSVKGDLDESSLDSRMLKVFTELDGKKDVASITRSLDIQPEPLRDVLINLFNLQIIERVEKTSPMLTNEFFDFLKFRLALSMGPIAEFLIEEEIRELGVEPTKIPCHMAAELVETLARQIIRDEKKIEFQQAMLKKIRDLKPA